MIYGMTRLRDGWVLRLPFVCVSRNAVLRKWYVHFLRW